MPASEVWTVVTPKPARRWTRPFAITPSDTNSDKRLQINGIPYRYIMNTGTSGAFVVTWEPDNDTGTAITLYLAQGQVLEGGLWVNVRATGLTAGLTLIGFQGREDVGS